MVVLKLTNDEIKCLQTAVAGISGTILSPNEDHCKLLTEHIAANLMLLQIYLNKKQKKYTVKLGPLAALSFQQCWKYNSIDPTNKGHLVVLQVLQAIDRAHVTHKTITAKK